jgi:hypothetical protein
MQDEGAVLNQLIMKNRSSLWIAMLPALSFMLIGLYTLRFGLDAYVASADPSYNYLVNSYEVMTGAAPFAIHHPGTTLQYLMGVTNWVSWLVAGRQDGSFGYSIVSQPEWYLEVDLFVLILLQTAALAYSSIIIARRWGIAASFGFSGGVLLLAAPDFNLFLVGPVALSFSLALVAVGLAVKIISRGASTTVSALFGVILVSGVMNKATFLPMLALLGIYFTVKGFRAALVGGIATVVIFVVLIREQIFHLGYWFIGLLSTTGRNPSDISNVSTLEKIIDSPEVLINAMPWLVVVLLVSLGSLTALVFHSRKNSDRLIDNSAFIVSITVIAVIAGSAFMTIKDYRQGDLIVVAAVAPVLLAASFRIVTQLHTGVVLRALLSITLIVLVVVASIYFVSSQITFAREEASPEYKAQIEYLESKRSQGNHVAMAYGVFTPGSALGFGDDLSNHLLYSEINSVYPRQLALSLETLEIQSRGKDGLVTEPCEVLASRLTSGSELIVAPGRTVDPEALANANGATTIDLVETFGQWPVYSLVGFECPTD